MRNADDPYITLTTKILYNPTAPSIYYVVVLKAIRGMLIIAHMEKKKQA